MVVLKYHPRFFKGPDMVGFAMRGSIKERNEYKIHFSTSLFLGTDHGSAREDHLRLLQQNSAPVAKHGILIIKFLSSPRIILPCN